MFSLGPFLFCFVVFVFVCKATLGSLKGTIERSYVIYIIEVIIINNYPDCHH